MRANWQTCKRRRDLRGRWVALYVTMNPRGEISMSRLTYEKLGEPAAVQLLFDSVNNRIGLKPSHREAREAFPVGKRGSHGGRRIHAYTLMQEFRIDLPSTIQFYDADIDDDGVLILDLRTARVPSRVLNHPQASRL